MKAFGSDTTEQLNILFPTEIQKVDQQIYLTQHLI